MTYVYLKQDVTIKIPKKIKNNSVSKGKKRKVLAFAFFSLGSFLLFSAVVPILSFSVRYSGSLNQVVSPLSNRFYNQDTVLGDADIDYTQLNNWFVNNTNPNLEDTSYQNSPQSYTISIPTLKIDQAQVVVGGEDLKKSLIQYPNTALPGQLGNSVIFGHSVLPQFFNPKSYLTIFSTLYKLKQGDEIFVDYDKINYRYIVEQMYEVTPSDLSVLEQRFDGRFLTIITCSPPGTYLRRLIVKARIVDI